VLFNRKTERQANLFLAFLLILIAFDLVPQIIGFAGFYDAFPWLSFAPFSNASALGPLLLGYVFAMTTSRVSKVIYAALIPSITIFLYHCYWFLQPLQDKWDWVASYHGSVISPIFNYYALTLALVSVIISFLQIRRYRHWLANLSSAAMEFDQRWLPHCLIGFLIPLIAWLFMDVYAFLFGRLSYFEAFPFYIILSFSAYAIAQGAITKSKFSFPKMQHSDVSNEINADCRQVSALEEAELNTHQRDAAKLRDVIVTEKLYLQPRLSLQDLARHMATNETYISRIINQGTGGNFNRFVNQIRVECAQEGIKSKRGDLLQIALDSGFNSKATFNRVFKDITQLTPSQYKRQLSH